MYINKELLLYEINKLETIDKDILLKIIENCTADPYKDLLLKLYKEGK